MQYLIICNKQTIYNNESFPWSTIRYASKSGDERILKCRWSDNPELPVCSEKMSGIWDKYMKFQREVNDPYFALDDSLYVVRISEALNL